MLWLPKNVCGTRYFMLYKCILFDAEIVRSPYHTTITVGKNNNSSYTIYIYLDWKVFRNSLKNSYLADFYKYLGLLFGKLTTNVSLLECFMLLPCVSFLHKKPRENRSSKKMA